MVLKLALLFAVLAIAANAQDYPSVALKLHNQYRKLHHAKPLKLDNNLNNIAKKCAQHMLKQGKIQHNCPYVDKSKHSDNLYGGDVAGNPSDIQIAKDASKMWYDEVKWYSYKKPGFTLKTGHFTAMVWKNSDKFGFGIAKGKGKAFAVAIYNPPANYPNQFPKNVLPK